ncbi:HNH endonuclease signature motif containing protein [Prosthecomicrobium hirschii]|uniref:HNH endonuclease signature motif containing protein n=1 Tax=Prosthecodimorpha hirschii TaxID=665126 RepID=UPI003B84A088
MPKRAPRICGCGLSIASGNPCPCERKRRAAVRRAHDETRPDPAARGYDAEWRKVRAAFLARNPCCAWPECEAKATEVDHIESVRARPDLRLSWSNLRPYCKPHHSRRTARDQGFARPGGRSPTLADRHCTVVGPSLDREQKSATRMNEG